MDIPFVIDNQTVFAADVLKRLLARTSGGSLDVASAYFTVSGYKVLRDALEGVGGLRLLLGKEPEGGGDLGLRPREAVTAELAGRPFDRATRELVSHLIEFLRQEKVQVRAFAGGFLHAKAYLFHQDRVGPGRYDVREMPFAAVVGSSNFTGPGLAGNRELNLVHRVFTEQDAPADAEASRRTDYLRAPEFRARLAWPTTERGLFGASEQLPAPEASPLETMFDPAGVEVPAPARRSIKSEVGARAVMELERWFVRNWEASADFKQELIDLLDRSAFGGHEYTPYQIYLKALYEYLKDQLDASDDMLTGRSAVDLAEFQADAARRARRILQRYDGVLIADSVGLGKTWIGKKLLEDFAYHRRMKAIVVCPASLRDMWRRELAEATIAADVVGMEELGRDSFDVEAYADADVILIDESHNFRNQGSNRYLKLDDLIQRRGGRGRDGDRKKIILLSATPINNDLYDLLRQVKLFTQNQPDYFREAGIGDLDAYFKHARSQARREGTAAGELLFNLLDEFVVRNTRPYIRAAYPNATINGERVSFPDRELKTIEYSLEAVWGGLYAHVANQVESLSLAPYALESYKKSDASKDKWEEGREQGLVGIFKTRFLKRLESSVAAFRLSVHRALLFEKVYLDFLLSRRVVASRDFWKMLRLAGLDGEDELDADTLADELENEEAVREHLGRIPPVDLNEYDLRRLVRDVERDVELLRDLHARTAPLAEKDAKLARLKELLAGELKGKKVLIFTSFKDTARYLGRALAEDDPAWLASAGNPNVRRIDSANSPDERAEIVAAFSPESMGRKAAHVAPIDILISTDVLSEGQNLQDCGVLINYDLTWNPIRLVQRSGRIDRLRSRHTSVQIWNMFPEKELELLLKLVERLTERLSRIDELGMLDASVLGEVVHPRTFNVIRRVLGGDATVLDEEEARAELAGPELLLRQLREMLNRGDAAAEVANLPDGIHSGLRREKSFGMFFYFKAPRASAGGWRHFWRYIDARSHDVTDNRFQIAQLIACRPDEPRVIGPQDVIHLQERVVRHILRSEEAATATAAGAAAPDPVQLQLAEQVKAASREGAVDRDAARAALHFLTQPAGKAIIAKLKELRKAYPAAGGAAGNAGRLVGELEALAAEYRKPREPAGAPAAVRREELRLVCFDYLCS